jgi:hypothetical protein
LFQDLAHWPTFTGTSSISASLFLLAVGFALVAVVAFAMRRRWPGRLVFDIVGGGHDRMRASRSFDVEAVDRRTPIERGATMYLTEQRS